MSENPSAKYLSRIEKETIESSLPEIGGTKIVFQRHAEYERSKESEFAGSLTDEGINQTHEQSVKFFDQMLDSLPENEKATLMVLVLASDTAFQNKGQRSMETAETVIDGLRQSLARHNLEEKQLLNISGNYSTDGLPRPVFELQEPRMFEDSPEYVEFLKNKYGDLSIGFWRAFEEDVEKETRDEMGAEGPEQIVSRLSKFIKVLERYSRLWHKNNPNKRLIVWATTHYDTISPFIKQEIYGVDKDYKLAVDYGAGFTINIDPIGKMEVPIGDLSHKIE